MHRARRLRRPALLALAMLFAGAANDYGGEDGAPESHYQPAGTFGAYLTGRFAAQRTDLDTAADKLEAVATQESGLREITTQAFLAAALAGRPAAARLAAGLPDNPVAQLVLADRDALAGQWDSAEARFQALPQNGVTQVLRPLLIAWAQQGAMRTDAALNTLKPSLEGQRYRGVTALHAGLIADLGGRPAEAGQLYRLALSDYGALNLRLGTILASWQARQGQVEEAQRTIRDLAASSTDLSIARLALEADVANPAVQSATDGIAEAYLALAATLRQQNAGDSADVLLRLALDLRPGFTAARLLLADIQEMARRNQAALQTLAPVPADDPLSAVVRLRQANLMDAVGRPDEAAQALEELAREHPDRPEPLAQAGDLLRRKSRFAEAAAMYDRAVSRIGTPTRANWPLFYERGVARDRAGQWPDAEKDFEYALQLAPDQPAILNYLGYAWTEQGRNLDRARTMLERAAQERPNDGAIVDSLGWLLLRQGEAAAALAHLEHAVEMQPEDPVINGHYGDALAAVGRVREAGFQWQRALTMNPEADDAQRITAKLQATPEDSAPVPAAAPR